MKYTLKQTPADFIVIEDSAIDFTGHGEHLWLWIEKENLTTDVALSLLAKAFDINLRDANAAGKKDRHAITRQWVSLQRPGKALPSLDEIQVLLQTYFQNKPLYEGERLEVLDAHLHQKKCQTGCHKGNRFIIQARCESALDADAFQVSAAAISTQGFPNRFGDQRFGKDGISLQELDAQICRIRPGRKGRLKPKDAWTCSQLRSALFNEYIDLRLEQQLWREIIAGDVMNLAGSQSCFHVAADEITAELQQRLIEQDIVTTGPLFGRPQPKLAATDAALELEDKIWSRLSEPAQKSLCQLQEAARRPLWNIPKEFEYQLTSDGVSFSFWLAKGAYATECVRALFQRCACDQPQS